MNINIEQLTALIGPIVKVELAKHAAKLPQIAAQAVGKTDGSTGVLVGGLVDQLLKYALPHVNEGIDWLANKVTLGVVDVIKAASNDDYPVVIVVNEVTTDPGIIDPTPEG